MDFVTTERLDPQKLREIKDLCKELNMSVYEWHPKLDISPAILD